MTPLERQNRIEELNQEISKLSEERSKLEHEILAEKSLFKVGDIISWKSGQNRRRGKVIRIQGWCCDNPYWFVQSIRKNGSSGEGCTVRSYMNPKKEL